METKYFEIRDSATRIIVMAMRAQSQHHIERQALRACGYSDRPDDPITIVMKLDEMDVKHDPYEWGGSNTMKIAHHHIMEHWQFLFSGQVIDVEVIRGVRSTVKSPEVFV